MNNQLIYVVDDSADYRLLVEHMFAQFLPQYTVVFFSDGEALLERLHTETSYPALILLDLHMPLMSGHQTLLQLKQKRNWKSIPVVMVTSSTSNQEIRACYEAGANSCLEKPNGGDKMRHLLEQVCSYWINSDA